ncbi:enoyl-CoA hydratase-related protein [Glycomyces sp. NRRL B-16210]|uniref:enoyl-CoA hydratase-related protein n=1 Tax=Glycomyces sp. NRRL B-16210 TaxID=1463821 RepID=UPI0004BF15B6|nr:enoyl-CoA hydratase-related protein [Glycomyces sp. NRRL B-16210]
MTGNDAPIAYEAKDAVATITLDDPARRNALSTRLIAAMREALAAAVADPEVRVIVVDHTGPVFCAGGDLKESAAAERAEDLPAVHLADLLWELCEAPKPVVAVARGAARGGGLGLLAAADITICLDEAEMAFSEVRLGVVPAVIAPVVARKIGAARMRALFLTGYQFQAGEAEPWGLVTFSTYDGIDAAVAETVSELLAGGPQAQAGIKALTATPELREQLQAEAVRTAEYFLSSEGREGVRSFLEKRTPSWVG